MYVKKLEYHSTQGSWVIYLTSHVIFSTVYNFFEIFLKIFSKIRKKNFDVGSHFWKYFPEIAKKWQKFGFWSGAKMSPAS